MSPDLYVFLLLSHDVILDVLCSNVKENNIGPGHEKVKWVFRGSEQVYALHEEASCKLRLFCIETEDPVTQAVTKYAHSDFHLCYSHSIKHIFL